MEIRWKSDKTKYDNYIKRRKEAVALLKKHAKPERLSRGTLERWMKENKESRGI